MSLSRAVFSLNMFQSGRKPTRPSAGWSRAIFWPPQAASAASIEPYFRFSQSPNWASTIRSSGSGIVFGVERPEEIRVLVDDFQARDGRVVDQPLAGRGLGREQQGLPPLAVLLLKVLVEVERGEGVLVAVVAGEQVVAGFGLSQSGK